MKAQIYDKESGIRVIEVETLLAIYKYMNEQNTPYPIAPSVREIMALTGIKSTNTMHRRLGLMREHGLVTKQNSTGQVRNARLTTYGVAFAQYAKHEIGTAPKETGK